MLPSDPVSLCMVFRNVTEKSSWQISMDLTYLQHKLCHPATVKPVLTDQCHAAHPSWKTTVIAKGLIFQCNWTCHKRPPVLGDCILITNGLVFQDWFYSILEFLCTVLIYSCGVVVLLVISVIPDTWHSSSVSYGVSGLISANFLLQLPVDRASHSRVIAEGSGFALAQVHTHHCFANKALINVKFWVTRSCHPYCRVL